MLLEMVGASKELRALRESIMRKAKGLKVTPNLYDRNRLMAALQSEKQQFMQIMRSATAKESFDVRRELPRPPASRELYGRILVRKRVLDVGSGDGRRLVQLAARVDLETVDRVVTQTILNVPHYTMDARDVPGTYDLYVSFNAVTETPELLNLGEGMHVYPDMEVFLKSGHSVQVGDQYRTVTQRAVYMDYLVDRPCVRLSGYCGTNVYVDEHFEAEMGESERLGLSFNAVGRRVEGSDEVDEFLDDGELTVKYDGELGLFVASQGVARLCFRDGSVMEGVWSGRDVRMYLEILEDRIILLKLEYYDGWEPFHSLSLLEYFLKCKRLTINGTVVEPPERWQKGLAAVEGLVMRRENEDFLLTAYRTFDLDGSADVKDVFEAAGSIRPEGELRPGVNEYVLDRYDKGARLIWKKERKKIVGQDEAAIRRILMRPALSDYVEFSELAREVCDAAKFW